MVTLHSLHGQEGPERALQKVVDAGTHISFIQQFGHYILANTSARPHVNARVQEGELNIGSLYLLSQDSLYHPEVDPDTGSPRITA